MTTSILRLDSGVELSTDSPLVAQRLFDLISATVTDVDRQALVGNIVRDLGEPADARDPKECGSRER